MRVIAGEFRRRTLKPVPGDEVRPTPDRLRETLFSILAPRIEDTVFVDAYAGTGAVGIEALSRGARRAIFLEKNPAALAVLRENLDSLKIGARGTVVRGPAGISLRGLQADIVFIDPPYAKTDEYEGALASLRANPPELVIVQHSSRFDVGAVHGKLTRFRIVKQGDNSLSFYSPVAADEG